MPEIAVIRLMSSTELGSQVKRRKVALEMKGGTRWLWELPVGFGSFPDAGQWF